MAEPEVSKAMIKEYMKNRKVLIADSSKSFSAVVQKTCIEYGSDYQNTFIGSTWERAENMMNKNPEIIFSEYQITGHYCLDLAPMQRQIYEKQQDRVFIVITSTSTDSAVAEAAEEEIDAYLLKPFSLGQLQETIKKVVGSKIQPSDYSILLQEAQDLLKANKIPEAEEKFLKATGMSNKPSLAWYYAGYTAELTDRTDLALERYREGRKFNNIHYKCLQGEFNILFKQRKETEAYQVIKLITENFPVTPQLLAKIFTLSVLTRSIGDLEQYYKLYTNLDRRPPELIKIVSAAMMTAGRLSLLKKDGAAACGFFKKGVTTTGREMGYIEKIIQLLLDEKLFNESEEFFKMWPPEEVGKERHALINFKIAKNVVAPEQVLNLGKQLIGQGLADEEVFRTSVKILVDQGRANNAEDIIFKATQKYPTMKTELYGMLK